jgi:hypothetical protein
MLKTVGGVILIALGVALLSRSDELAAWSAKRDPGSLMMHPNTWRLLGLMQLLAGLAAFAANG